MQKNFKLFRTAKKNFVYVLFLFTSVRVFEKWLFFVVVRIAITQLAERRCDNVVTTSLLTLSQLCGTVENESCTDVSFRRCGYVALQRCQDVASTLLQRRHNIKHWISTRPFYYGLFWFLSLHRNVKVTKVLSGIKHASFLFKKALYL